MRSFRLPLAALAVLACASLAPGASAAGGTTRPYDAHWLRAMAQSDVFEVASSRLALARTEVPNVTQVAQRLVADHLAALGKERALARQLRIPLPRRADPVQTMLINQLARTPDPTAFKQLYVRMQIAAHEQAILTSAEAASVPADPRVRRLATSLLPVLQRHLQMAHTLAQQLGLPEGRTAT